MTASHNTLVLCLALSVGIAACAPFPELETQQIKTADTLGYPALVPLEPLFDRAQDSQITPQVQSGLEGRIARLKARAARLRGTVVDAPTRQRMREGVQGISQP